MAADITAVINTFRLRAEIAVGATTSVPKYEQQLELVKSIFIAKSGADGSESTSISMEGTNYSVQYRGATPEQITGALEFLYRELQGKLTGATQTMAPHGMSWSSRPCES